MTFSKSVAQRPRLGTSPSGIQSKYSNGGRDVMKRGRTKLSESEKADPCRFGDNWKNIGLDQNETSISSGRKLSKIPDWVLEVIPCLCYIQSPL